MLTMNRGDTAIFTMTVNAYSGAYLDLTGAEVWFTAKYGWNDTDDEAVFQKTVGDGVTITDPTNGEIEIQLEQADTATIVDSVRLRYDVQVRDVSGGIYTVASGLLKVVPDVTRTVS